MSDEDASPEALKVFRSRVPSNVARILDALSGSWRALEPSVGWSDRFNALAGLFSATRDPAALAELQFAVLRHYGIPEASPATGAEVTRNAARAMAADAAAASPVARSLRAGPLYRAPQRDIDNGLVRNRPIEVTNNKPMYAFHYSPQKHTVKYNFTSTIERWYVSPDYIANFGTDLSLPELPFDKIPTSWLCHEKKPSKDMFYGAMYIERPDPDKEKYFTFYHKLIYTDIQVVGSDKPTVVASFEKT